MGSRADFYVGRGPQAEWLGSIAWDGYPEGIARVVLESTTEEAYRAAVKAFIEPRRDCTLPAQGWPWPWENSNTTDYAYAFDGGVVYGTCFGAGWWKATEEPEDSNEFASEIPDSEWPDMSQRKNNPRFGDERSGLIAFG